MGGGRQDCCERLGEKLAGKMLGSFLTQKPFSAEKERLEVGSNLFGEGAGGAAGRE